MAATIDIKRHTGSGPTKTTITSTTNRAAAADDPAPGTSNPVLIPTSGTNYSYWVVARLAVGATGPANGINNLKWYSDGSSFGTGIVCNGNTASAYVQATGTTGTTGDELTTSSYSTLTATPADVTTFTSGSPKTVTGSLAGGAVSQDFGHYFVYQLAISSTASVGTVTARTFTWTYDET